MYIDGKVKSITKNSVRIENSYGDYIDYKTNYINKVITLDSTIRVFISDNDNYSSDYSIVSAEKIYGNLYRYILNNDTEIVCHDNVFKVGDTVSISFQELKSITEPTDF